MHLGKIRIKILRIQKIKADIIILNLIR